MKTTIIGLILLSAVSARAQSLNPPTIAFTSGAVADWTTTAVAIHHGAIEANPIVSWADPHNAPATIAVGAAIDTACVLILRQYGKTHPKIASVLLYAGAAWRGAYAVHNAKIARRP